MTISFCLHEALAIKPALGFLRMCQILLEPNAHYPWVILVPQVPEASRLLDLNQQEQQLVWQDLQEAQQAIWSLQPLSQLNVGALGNRCPQLHIHVVGRREDDPAWPHPVWGHSAILQEAPTELEKRMLIIQDALQAASSAFRKTLDTDLATACTQMS